MSASQMRAIVIQTGKTGEEALDYVKNAPFPTIQSTEVLIQVKACAFSIADFQALSGSIPGITPSTHIPGTVIAGFIEKIGGGVQGFVVGDEVIAVLPLDVAGGCAEYASVPSSLVVKLPNNVTETEGVALIYNAVAAFTALHSKCAAAGGDSVLIINAASPQGWVTMQLANHFHLKVFVTAHSKEDFNDLNGLGSHVTRVIDTTSESVVEVGLEVTGQIGFDHIVQLDPLPGSIRQSDILHLLAPHGNWVTAESIQLDPPESKLLLLKGASLSFVLSSLWLLSPTQHGRFMHILNTTMELAGQGTLKARNINTYPLERTRQAFRDFGSKNGQIVLRV